MKFFNFSLLTCFFLFLNVYALDLNFSNTTQINEHIKDENKTTFKKLSYTQAMGKTLYEENCQKCHGNRGEKRGSTKSKKLTQMTSDEIYYTFKGYLTSNEFGGSSRMTMQTIASKITLEELEQIIAYVKNDDDFLKRGYKLKNTDISKKPTSQGVYIK